jgi:hypothetical protein
MKYESIDKGPSILSPPAIAVNPMTLSLSVSIVTVYSEQVYCVYSSYTCYSYTTGYTIGNAQVFSGLYHPTG